MGRAIFVFLLWSVVAWAQCPTLLAIQALQTDPAVAPPRRELVRAAIARLKPGQPADVAIAMLRRATWFPGVPLPPLRRKEAVYGGHYRHGGKTSRPHIAIELPRELLGTPLELELAMHEHQHARVRYLLPQLQERHKELADPIADDQMRYDAIDRAHAIGELQYWHERIALMGEAAVVIALTDDERAQMIALVERLPESAVEKDSKINLLAGLRAGPTTVEGYLYHQHRVGHYSRPECVRQWVEMVKMGQALHSIRAWWEEYKAKQDAIKRGQEEAAARKKAKLAAARASVP